jgi:hypothetical protein
MGMTAAGSRCVTQIKGPSGDQNLLQPPNENFATPKN